MYIAYYTYTIRDLIGKIQKAKFDWGKQGQSICVYVCVSICGTNEFDFYFFLGLSFAWNKMLWAYKISI